MKTEKEIREEAKNVGERINELYERFVFSGIDEETYKLEMKRLRSAKDALEWVLKK